MKQSLLIKVILSEKKSATYLHTLYFYQFFIQSHYIKQSNKEMYVFLYFSAFSVQESYKYIFHKLFLSL